MLSNFKAGQTGDVIVIGGGIIGCSIALRLAQAKLKVCVLDRGEPGGEASSAAAGMLAPQGETVEPDPFFEMCAASRDLYAQFVPEIEALSGQSVGYRRDGTLMVAVGDGQSRELDEIWAGQTKYGLPLERISPDQARNRIPGLSPAIASALFVAGDHWLDNERLAQALVKACRQLGVTFCERTAAEKFVWRNGRVEGVEARESSGSAATSFSGQYFVLAAGCWSGNLAASLGVSLPTQPCRGQMIEFETAKELSMAVRSGHHYLVPRPNRKVLAGTTAEYVGYEKEVTGDGIHSIIEGVSRVYPQVREFRFRRAWAGLRPDTRDHLPILGLGEFENLIFATGHFRNGILLAPITAKLISELILTGSPSMSIQPYRTTRFAL